MRAIPVAGVLAASLLFPAAHRWVSAATSSNASSSEGRPLVAPPTVTGPVANTTPLRDAAHGYPYNATPLDLAKHGYVEEEFWLQGTANRYATPAGEDGSLIDGNHAYKTRLVIRRPRLTSRFNGTVVVEWYNVSQGHDGEYDWFQSMDHLVRAGYAWAGVSNQAVGVNALREWSPARYGSLDVTGSGSVTGDDLSYDIFTAAALAIRPPASATRKASSDVMGGLKAARLIAIGHSQSAGRLYTYFHSVHPLGPAAYDGVVLHGGGGIVRTNLDVKVFKFLDETDVPGQVNNRQPDSDRFRQWEVAGSSHLNAQFSRALAGVGLRVSGMVPVEGSPAIDGPTISGPSTSSGPSRAESRDGGAAGNGGAGNGDGQANGGSNGGCEKPPFSRVPSQYALNAAIDHLARWIREETAPPSAPPVEVREAAAAAVDAQPARGRGAVTGPRWVVARDDAGNGLGGIRLSQHAVPTAANTGTNTGGRAGGERNCGLMGSHERFDAPRLAALYPTHAGYVTKVKDVTERNLRSGYLVKADASLTIAEAERSDIGRTKFTSR